jgi:hypothetical protein
MFTTALHWSIFRARLIQSILHHPVSLTDLLMELSASWEATNCAATQELPSVLWNPKVHYRLHKSPSPVPILSRIDPISTIPSYLSKIHFNIVHPPTSWSSHWSLSFWLSHQNFVYIPILLHACYMPCSLVTLKSSLNKSHVAQGVQWLRYRVLDRDPEVWFPVGARDFALLHSIQSRSGAHLNGYGGPLPWGVRRTGPGDHHSFPSLWCGA